MMHDFELHEFFHSPKNVLLKALLYPIIDKFNAFYKIYSPELVEQANAIAIDIRPK